MIAACVLDASIGRRQDMLKKRQRKDWIDVITHKTFNCLATYDKKYSRQNGFSTYQLRKKRCS
jgi:hypothetical protein